MKKILKYHLLILIIAGWAGLSLIGFSKKDTLYRNYQVDVKKTPYFALVLEGVRDGIYPWSEKNIPLWEFWQELANREEDETIKNTEKPVTQNNWNPQFYLPYILSPAIQSPSIPSPTYSFIIKSPQVSNRWFGQVDGTYFDDAVFIGDSRTAGLRDYGGLKNAVFYAADGLNIYDLWKKEFCKVDGQNVTLEEALSAKQFGKVYFQIGINEMGRGTVDGFMEAYEETVAKLRELQPNAIIFVQGIMRVTKEKSEKDPIFNNEGINLRNERIAELADWRNIFYIDMNEAVSDEEGHLDASLTFDDLHLYGTKYGVWVNFLLSHGVY